MSRVPGPIRWQDGMLLSPRHLQQLSLRLEELIQALPGRYHPYYWGVSRFEYLIEGPVLIARALDAVMPNGVHVSSDDGRLRLDLRTLTPGTPHTIHLAMSLSDADEARRFISCDRELSGHEILGDDGVEIPRIRVRLSLMAGARPPEAQYASLPLLEVRPEGDRYQPTAFMPPTLRVAPGSLLGARCARISDRLRREVATLTGAADAPQAPVSAEARSQLAPLASALPAFEALLTSEPHPFGLYVELCRLAGAVAMFRNRTMPPAFPAYVHDDAWTAFDAVTRFALGTPDAGPSRDVRQYPFEPHRTFFRLAPDPGWTGALAPGSGQRWVLAVQSEAGTEQARKWGEQAVIGSRDVVASLMSRRILGVARRYTDQADGLASAGGTSLFLLAPDATLVRPGEDLLVVGGTSDARPTSVTLHVLKGPEAPRHG